MSKRNENNPGYKKTKVGWIPEEWNCVYGKCAFSHSIEKGYDGLPILAVTMESGLVHRSSLDRKMPNAIAGDGSLHVRVGDIAYNMMRAWQGAIGLATEEGVISPAYVVLRPKKHVYSLFMFYLFKSLHGLYLIYSYSYGLTGDRLRLYYKDFAIIPIPLPPLPEQKKIAEILSAWDRAIDQAGKLIDAKQRLKKGLIQQLLTGRMRFVEFGKPALKKGELPEGWKIKPLGSFGSFSKGKGISNNLKRETGFPCITYGEIYGKHEIVIQEFYSYIDGDTAHNSQLIYKGDILFAGSGETLNEIGKCVAFTKDVEAYAGGDIVIFHPESVYSLYLSYSLNSDILIRQKRKLGQGHSVVHIYSAGLKTLQVPLPSLEEQTRIASILSVCDREIQLLVRKRDLLQEQKKGLMQKLLTGEVRVKTRARRE
ncbi:MAG: restriction endonuclease subunit S [Desulfobulbaceae bacterium]|nr:restriction endonuclease subunit S [Desulfobulbaceae bacterium]